MVGSDNDPDETNRTLNRSRRLFLSTVGAGLTTSIAGCTGGDGDGDGDGGDGAATTAPGDGGDGDGDGDGGDGEMTTEGDGGDGQSQVQPAQFTVGAPQQNRHLDPHAMNESTMNRALLMYQPLVGRKVGVGSELRPLIATEWEAQDNAKTWVFQVREGVSFDDGTPVDGYAVKRSLERTNNITADQSLPYSWLDTVEQTGDYEVTLHGTQAFAAAPQTLTHVTASIINPTALDEHWDDDQIGHEYFKTNVHGTGPYELVDWDKGNFLTAKRKEDHWLETTEGLSANLVVPDNANIADYRFQNVQEPITGRQLLGRSELDWYQRMPWQQVKNAISQDNVELFDGGPEVKWVMVGFNCADPVTSDVNLRRAMSYVVDYEGIVNGLYEDAATVMGTPWQKNIWPRRTDTMYRQDLDKANEFMSQSDYDGETIEFKSIAGTVPSALSEALQSNFAEIGVDTDFKAAPPPQFFEAMGGGPETAPQLWLGTPWPDYLDPDGIAVRWWSQMWPGRQGFKNLCFWEDGEYDQLFKQGRRLQTKAARTPIYNDIQQMLFEDPPTIWLAQQNYVAPRNAGLSNLEYTAGANGYIPVHKFHKESS